MISRSIKQSKAYLKMSLSRMFETKLGLFIWSLVGFASTFAIAYGWYVAGRDKPEVAGLEYDKILAYYILRFILWYFVGGVFCWIIEKAIKEGSLSNYLLKPGNFLIYPIFWEQGWKIASFLLAIPATIIFSVSLGVSPFFGINLGSFLLAIPAVIIGGIIFVEIQVLIGLSTLWAGSAHGADSFYNLINNLLGGFVVPIILTPIWFQQICEVLPFKYMFAFPVEIAQVQYGSDQVLKGFIVQSVWMIILFFAAKKIFTSGMKRYEGFGN